MLVRNLPRVGFFLGDEFYVSCDGGAVFRRSRSDRLAFRAAGFRSCQSYLYSPLMEPGAWLVLGADTSTSSLRPVFVHRGQLVVGPSLDDASVCPGCFFLRLAAASPHPEWIKAILRGDAFIDPDFHELLADEVTISAAVGKSSLAPGEFLTRPVQQSGDFCKRRILPVPGVHPFHGSGTRILRDSIAVEGYLNREWEEARTSGGMLDSFCGLIADVRSAVVHSDAPSSLESVVATTGFLGFWTAWKPDLSGAGTGFGGDLKAPAIGEAIERYCGNFIPGDLQAGTEALLAERATVISPHAFRCFGIADEPANRLGRYDSSSEIEWVRGVDAAHGSSVYVPAELAFLNYTRVAGRAAVTAVNLAGIAAHRSEAAAVEAATLELVERDASMLWWHGGQDGRVIQDAPSALHDLVAPRSSSFEYWWIALQCDFPVHVIAGVLYNRNEGTVAVGLAARPSVDDAMRKAMAEAWQLAVLNTQLLDRSSEFWRLVAAGKMPWPVVSYRADRHYRDSFAPDFSDMDQLAFNLQYYLDPVATHAAIERLRVGRVGYTELCGQLAGEGSIVRPVALHCSDSGGSLAIVDLTTPDVAGQGFHVARVITDKLVGNSATAFVQFGHPRFTALAAAGKLRAIREPMPHA
jgi:ribosomal protein S12 methylthiotransferase accessory factor